MKLTFTFVNPNPPKAVEQMLRAILLEKILSRIEPDRLPAAS